MSYITSIQKYCIHDGDGIRTTVFYKGCPLNCTWCHNPETQNYKPQLSYSAERCTGCGHCIEVCPSNAISREQDHVALSRDLCRNCGTCVEECLANAREIVGEQWTQDKLIQEIEKDEAFYEQSGGGVTLSGGEVMTMDMDEIESLVRKLHKRGISVTIDTCGFAPYENFERILPYVNTFLYDIKSLSSEIHKKYTGVDTELILGNLKRLSKAAARIYLRLPLIQEVNASEEQIQELIEFLGENQIHPAGINLLPYHNTGSSKYPKLGEQYQGQEFHAPEQKELEQYRQMLEQAGYQNVKIGG